VDGVTKIIAPIDVHFKISAVFSFLIYKTYAIDEGKKVNVSGFGVIWISMPMSYPSLRGHGHPSGSCGRKSNSILIPG